MNKEKAVAIAKDVLLQIKIITPLRGAYMSKEDQLDLFPHEELQKHINQVATHCEVCALGAAFLSKVRLFNECQSGEVFCRGFPILSRKTITTHLEDIFSDDQLNMIESAFECRPIVFNCDYKNSEHIRKSVTFGKRYKTDVGRLRAIMNNIVRNGGEFLPY